MAGAANIVIGLNVSPFLAGIQLARKANAQFTNDFVTQFERIKAAASGPQSAVANLTRSLSASQRLAGAGLSARAPQLASGPNLGAGLGAGVSNTIRQSLQAIQGQAIGAGSALGGIPPQLRQITGAGLGMGALSNVIGGVFAVDKLLGFGQAITSTSGKFEKFQSILTNALGSRTGAQESLKELANFAATTPNQLDELTGSYLKFVNRGIIPTKQQLTNFGDLAASQGKGFDQLTEAVLDAQTGEFERLKEFGIRASKSGDQVTLAFKGVSKTVKATTENITEVIQGFGQLNGVAGSMASVSQTLEGQVSNLGDSYDRLLVALGNAGVAGGYKLALGAAQSFLSVITELVENSPAEDLRKQQTELNGLVGAIALANSNEAVRLSLIQQLNQQYPEFLGRLDAESVTSDILAQRLAAVNTQYEKKIRLALGQEKIKKATDDLTNSIRQQGSALQSLAKLSGKSITDLEKLSPKQQIDLAKQIGKTQPKTDLGMGVFGDSQATNLATILEGSAKRQAAAQTELNTLLGENATRQADLTASTVAGYQQEIAQIREKIKLKQIDSKLGSEEIKRLEGQVRIAQGKTATPTPVTTGKATSAIKATTKAVKEQVEAYQTAANEVEFWEGMVKSLEGQLKKLEDNGSIVSPELTAGLAAAREKLVEFKKIADNFKSRVIEIQVRVTQQGESTDRRPFSGQASENGGPPIPLKQVGLPGFDGSQPPLPGFAEFQERMKEAQDKIEQSQAEFRGAMQKAREQLALAGVDLLVGLSESLAVGNTNPLKSALKSILDIISGYMIKIGSALLLSGLVSTAAGAVPTPLSAFLLASGINSKLAGATLVAGGGLVKGIAAKAFKNGGTISGPTYALVGEYAGARGNNEWIAPIDKGAALISQNLLKTLVPVLSQSFTASLSPIQANLNYITSSRAAQIPQVNPNLKNLISAGSSSSSVEVYGDIRIRGNDLLVAIKRAERSAAY